MKHKIDSKIVVRIAPSPTGSLHIGTARTALFNYLFARKNNGVFAVRFEDTDKVRSEKKYEKEILDSLKWLCISPDVIVRQSDRTEIYKKYIDKLIKNDSAYISKEPSKKDPEKEISVVRFRNKDPVVVFSDTVRGEIKIDTSDLADFVIARDINDPLYNLAVVIDDIEMGVTHVLRGDDHIINTPRQILLYKAFGMDLPEYTHIPLVHSANGEKLSKRKNSQSIINYKEKGYIKDAILNTIALLGWSSKDDKEIFSIEELISSFDIKNIQKKSAIFDEKKLNWYNKQFMHILPISHIYKEVMPSIRKRFPILSFLKKGSIDALVVSLKDRGDIFSETREMIKNGEYDFYFKTPKYSAEMLIPKNSEVEKKEIGDFLLSVSNMLNDFKGEWNRDNIKDSIWKYAEEKGKASVLWPMRVALSGKEKSPTPFEIAEAIGKKNTLLRIKNAISLLK